MPVNIHGKQYKTVAERINEINTNEVKYSLTTEIISWENELIVMKATLKFDGRKFTGHSYEKENTTNINKTSALENCETSCIGRALASAGYGGEEFASADELVNALAQQQEAADTGLPFPQAKNDKLQQKYNDPVWSLESRTTDKMPVGNKHKGKFMCDVPSDYHKWIVEKSSFGESLKEYCKQELEHREKNATKVTKKKESKETKEVKDYAESVIKKLEDKSEDETEVKTMSFDEIAKEVEDKEETIEQEDLPF